MALTHTPPNAQSFVNDGPRHTHHSPTDRPPRPAVHTVHPKFTPRPPPPPPPPAPQSSHTSLMLTIQAILYYVSLHVLWFFGVERVVFHFKADLEWLVCRLTGARRA